MNSDSAGESSQDDAYQSPVYESTVAQSVEYIHNLSQHDGQDRHTVYQEARWKRLGRHYNEEYLDLFIADQTSLGPSASLPSNQLGSVTWTSEEKSTFFAALARKGRHDLPSLAAAIGTKSIVEVRDYLERLKEADREHQMFAKHAKNASLADMDAAVEISKELDHRLEQAADALAAFQDRYDLAKARGNRGMWLIDTTTAQSIDEQNDEREAEEVSNSVEASRSSSSDVDGALQMFCFETMLELSRSMFMNSSTEGEHGHWTEYADGEEEPSITVEATEILYGLVKSLVQRVLQVSLFLAQSRLRATTTPAYKPSNTLKDVDVTTALDILKMPLDSWSFWTHFPRRSGLSVILGEHRKGQNEFLSLEQIESTLSVRSSRARHRSLSAMISQSSQEPESNADGEGNTQMIRDSPNRRNTRGSPTETSAGEDERRSSSVIVNDNDNGNERMNEEHDSGTDGSGEDEQRTYVSRKRRRILIEESQDEYLDELDHAAQLEEEYQLGLIFGITAVKDEPQNDLPRKPRVRRKTTEELRDWAEVNYSGSWKRNEPCVDESERLVEDD